MNHPLNLSQVSPCPCCQNNLSRRPDFSRHVEKLTRNLTPQPPSLAGKGENSKPLSLQERGLERGFSDPVKSEGRRHFLKSFIPGAVAFTILQSAAPAKAETHQPKALVLTCIDFRFVTAESKFLAKKHLGGQYDLTALAGASLAVTGFPHPSDAEAFWDQLDIAYKLHHINKVIVIDHQDCGAYAMMIDSNLSKNPEQELKVHKDYLNRAYWLIRHRYPKLEIELYFALLNQAEFLPVSPI